MTNAKGLSKSSQRTTTLITSRGVIPDHDNVDPSSSEKMKEDDQPTMGHCPSQDVSQ